MIFQGFYGLYINNSCLISAGTLTDSIFFFIKDTTMLSQDWTTSGGWKGIKINNSHNSKLEFCSIQHMKNVNSLSEFQTSSIIIFNSNNVLVANCLLKTNKTLLHSSIAPLGTSEVFYGCNGIIEINDCSPLIQYNSFINNSSGSGIIYCTGFNAFTNLYNGPIIDRNLIYNNIAWDRGAGIYTYGGTNPSITSNFIFNNYCLSSRTCYPNGGGMALGSPAYVANNVIANNTSYYEAGGIAIYSSDCIIINNTIANNKSITGISGGLFIYNLPNLKFINNIIWGNRGDSNIIFPLNSQLTVHGGGTFQADVFNNCIEGGLSSFYFMMSGNNGNYVNNDSLNPSFINSSGGASHLFDGLAADWRLQNNSPCINIGTLSNLGNLPAKDCWHNNRIIGTSIEIGAYEAPAEVQVGINEMDTNSGLSVYPNPATSDFTINLKDYENATVSVVNTLGQTIETKQFNNSEKMNFNTTDYSKGTYFLNIVIDNERMSSKLILQ